jgi:peptide-methionine (S)-S-oxide reductase
MKRKAVTRDRATAGPHSKSPCSPEAVSGASRTSSGCCRHRSRLHGGWLENPTYHDTHDSKSGHAEAVRITFRPSVLTYHDLLENWFFKLHDPTTLNRQGNDVGTQYRSAIFPQTPEQQATAELVIARVGASGRWSRPIPTTVEPASTWYSAEDYHQDYLRNNPGGYTCHFMRE